MITTLKHLTNTLALIAICSPAMAKLSYPVVDTNQELFYDNSTLIAEPTIGSAFYGQDAQFTRNKPSYTDNGDGTITDNVTGLMWQKEFKALSYDDAIKLAKQTTTGGHNDWRVPTIKEAYSLIFFSGVDASSRDMNSVPQGAIPFIATDYFDFAYGANGSRSIDTQMLSSTFFVGSSQNMQQLFGVNLADGRIKGYPRKSRDGAKLFSVRFVRGASYGINDFHDNKNGTISDQATGLMWQKKDSGKGMDWQSALEYAAKMNKKKYLGYSDWRVPNAKELQSIVDYSRSPESSNSAAIDPIFDISKIKNEGGDIDYPFFWSSTTHALAGMRSSGGSAAAYVCFGRGLGNMPQRGMGNMLQQNGNGNMSQHGGMNGGNRAGMSGRNMGGNMERGMAQQSTTSATNWIDIHGAGAQRSDPKSGDPSQYANGRGPQGDAIRINNYVRLVRDI